MPWQSIDQLAAVEQKLGKATAEHPYSRFNFLYRMGQCALGVAVGVVLFVAAIGTGVQTGAWGLPTVMILLALVALGVSGYFIWDTLAWQHHRLKVFPAGLLSIQKSRFIIINWGQVESFWQKITIHLDSHSIPFLPKRRTHRFTLQLKDGEKVVLMDSLQDIGKLGETIANETTRRMLPAAQKSVNTGGTVAFGNWAVSRAGLQCGGKATVPWPTISNVVVNNGVILVTQQGKFLPAGTEHTAKIPNVDVMLELIDAYRGK